MTDNDARHTYKEAVIYAWDPFQTLSVPCFIYGLA